MKKFILPLLLILTVGMLAAVETEPSEVVGYFKKTIESNGWDAFALPFGYSNYDINEILCSQFSDGDYIGDVSGTDVFFCIDDYDGLGHTGWVGTSTELLPGKAYMLYRATSNPTLEYYLLGKVSPNTLVFEVAGTGNGGWSAFSLNEAREIDPNILNITGAIPGDFIGDISGGDVFYYISDYDGMGNPGWVGTTNTLVPTHAYWYNSQSPTDFSWTYIPNVPRSGIPEGSKINFNNLEKKVRK